jgi:hypothetical protein
MFKVLLEMGPRYKKAGACKASRVQIKIDGRK